MFILEKCFGQRTATTTHSTQIVLDVAEKYLRSGRTMTIDNFYSSMAIENQTHLVGTLRKNRVRNLKEVQQGWKYEKLLVERM